MTTYIDEHIADVYRLVKYTRAPATHEDDECIITGCHVTMFDRFVMPQQAKEFIRIEVMEKEKP